MVTRALSLVGRDQRAFAIAGPPFIREKWGLAPSPRSGKSRRYGRPRRCLSPLATDHHSQSNGKRGTGTVAVTRIQGATPVLATEPVPFFRSAPRSSSRSAGRSLRRQRASRRSVMTAVAVSQNGHGRMRRCIGRPRPPCQPVPARRDKLRAAWAEVGREKLGVRSQESEAGRGTRNGKDTFSLFLWYLSIFIFY